MPSPSLDIEFSTTIILTTSCPPRIPLIFSTAEWYSMSQCGWYAAESRHGNLSLCLEYKYNNRNVLYCSSTWCCGQRRPPPRCWGAGRAASPRPRPRTAAWWPRPSRSPAASSPRTPRSGHRAAPGSASASAAQDPSGRPGHGNIYFLYHIWTKALLNAITNLSSWQLKPEGIRVSADSNIIFRILVDIIVHKSFHFTCVLDEI